ncbi:hypothetical protein IAR55_004926 [Kwoniella newhampshirensis]|uniref:Uncharacterized protein n=1 Tax=Kwoniella newhampshirensis TaxID=1651941 RepID=A0AAW0YM93_9TREE
MITPILLPALEYPPSRPEFWAELSTGIELDDWAWLQWVNDPECVTAKDTLVGIVSLSTDAPKTVPDQINLDPVQNEVDPPSRK